MKKIFVIINLVLLYGVVYAQTDNVTLKFTEEFALDSKEVNDTLFVQVSLPNSYNNSDKEYPIILASRKK